MHEWHTSFLKVMQPLPKGTKTPEQMAALAAARGTDFDRLFLQRMIAHHEGALTMVRDLLASPGSAYDPALFEFTNDVKNEQQSEIDRMNIILAGKDTTASCLSGLWFNLAREPEIYKKLQAEVAQLNGERPSYESLRNMKYIKHTVQESEHTSPFHLVHTHHTQRETSLTPPQPSASTPPPHSS